jgi:hypothetical protein
LVLIQGCRIEKAEVQMARPGSLKNERKINSARLAQAKATEEAARAELQKLKTQPVWRRPADYDVQLRKLNGILKKALATRKSETHSRKGKGGKR